MFKKNVVSDWAKNLTCYVHNISFAFVTQLYFHILIFCFVFKLFFQSHFMGQFSHFFYQSQTTIAEEFFLNFNYCFLFLVLNCLKTCVNCVAYCITEKFIPFMSKFTNIFFHVILWTN